MLFYTVRAFFTLYGSLHTVYSAVHSLFTPPRTPLGIWRVLYGLMRLKVRTVEYEELEECNAMDGCGYVV